MDDFVNVAADPHGNEERDRFLDLEELQFLSTEGIDKHGRRILRIVGKFLHAPIINRLHLKDYLIFKILAEAPQEPLCIVYFHTDANRAENSPGILNLRWIYEAVPQDLRQRLEAIYFVHPGALSRMTLAMVGRFLSDGLYDKVKYVNRVEFLWDDVRKGQVEIPEFVFQHDKVLEERPLMDYFIEPDPFSMLSSSSVGHGKPSRWGTIM
ncbi:hypothetical protein GOP47_0000346 [Adiantum capillus-veneris]|uniref:CRAL-TRIO domain-containing protein n=1 Tax=Adiantum capillus-veneris TaxID=13818 RepID=A0A9D4VEZ2_ADICA|nr:hypothetical protein GOP47_0000346 [Adiantum capillus-veneris]